MARTGNSLTAAEVLIIQAIADGTYFVNNETPTGTQNESNTVFTLAHAPTPAASLKLFKNGQFLTAGGEDYTLSGATITYVTAPFGSDVIRAFYTNSPT